MSRHVRHLALLLIGLAACGPRVSALFHDPSFTPTALWEGKITVLGSVAVPRIPDSDFMSSGFASRLLQKHTRARRPDLPLVADELVASTVDLDGLTTALDHYRTRGSLRPGDLEALAPLATTTRYAILSRIDTNLVDLKRDDLEEVDNDSVKSITEFDSVREVGSTFDVYDLQTGGLVWTAYLVTKRDHARRVEHGERSLDEEDSGLSFSSNAEAPDAPELAGLLEDLFRSFADQLPKR